MLYPILWLFASSFKGPSEVWADVMSLIPRQFTPQNYVNGWAGFGGITFATFYKNSLIYAGLGTVAAVLSSAVVAYGFARIRFAGRGFWFTCMLLTLMLPYQVVIIPQYVFFTKLNLVNTFYPLLLPRFFGMAFFIFMIMQFIRGIPKELDEAAEIDGCSQFGIFFRIILPLIRPALITATIFSFYWTWEDFLTPLVYLNEPKLYTISVALRSFADASGATDWGAIFAMSALSLVPVLACVHRVPAVPGPGHQHHRDEGLARGSDFAFQTFLGAACRTLPGRESLTPMRRAAEAAMPPPVRFGVIGVNHNHIYAQTDLLVRAGAELAGFFAEEGDLAAEYQRRYPQARRAGSRREILEDPRIHLIVSAAIPSERGPLGVEAMRHGKDYMSDKPAFTTLEQLAEARRAQAETGRIYSVCFSERFENAATVRAGELVKAGAIGKVVQTVGLGPHRLNRGSRPPWFFKRAQSGGILADIASHQMDQFLFMTGSTEAEVVAAQVANWNFPQWPEFEDFGDVVLRGNGGTGYARVDWFTPDGLSTWGDGRLVILGTDGYIELRKYVDIAGRPGASHLFLVDGKSARHVDAASGDLPYGRQLLADIVDRTETAMSQAHCFLACRLALEAQAKAVRLSGASAPAAPAPPERPSRTAGGRSR